MKRSTGSRPARLFCAIAPVCLLLPACDPVDSPSPAPARYKAPKLETRRATAAKPENVLWLNAWRNLRTDLEPLQEKLSSLQQFHADNRFDSFLGIDPETLDDVQLCTLYQFLERGYFTVERRILIDLLKRRLERIAEPAPQTESSLKDRLAGAMHHDELRMMDIETAIDYYKKTSTADLQIPNSLSDTEREELLTNVNRMVEKARSEVAEMDAKILTLREEVFPGSTGVSPVPEDGAGPESEAETVDAIAPPSPAIEPAPVPESPAAEPPEDKPGPEEPADAVPQGNFAEPPLPG
jgi:hypothetical protein